MGKIIMNQKKIFPTIVIGILLISVTGIFIPTLKAAIPDYRVAGFVFVDGSPRSGVVVTLSVPGKPDISTTTNTYGTYIIPFYATQGQIASFRVHVGYNYFIPTPPSFVIDHPSPPVYSFNDVNLSIDRNTTQPPNKPILIAPSPSGATIGSTSSATLQVQVTDPDGDEMDVLFYNANGNVLIDSAIEVSNGSTATITWSGLSAGTTYSWYAIANDSIKQNISDTWSFTTYSSGSNHPPNTPSSPNPSDGASNVDINADLSWTCTDPDAGDTLKYDVYFGTINPPTIKVSANQTSTSYDPSTMGYSTPYYWKIIAWDNHGATTAGPLWSFTTQSSGGGGSTTTDNLPTAEANGPYTGFVGDTITFDGTGSHDNDVSGSNVISTYDWQFFSGDSWHTNIGATPTHTYDAEGTYTVTLRVTDDEGSTATDTATVYITTANIPPTDPLLDGPTTGHKNTPYNYTAVSTDADKNDTIHYTFDWNDTTTNTTTFFPSGTTVTETHEWIAAGRYTINVTANDNQTDSGTTTLTVLIDAIYIDDLGYLIDTDGDGIYDHFHSNITGNETVVEQQDGNYLIDTDGDGTPDKLYNPDTDELTDYNIEEENAGQAKANNAALLTIGSILGIIIILVIVLLLVLGRKKRKEKTPAEKATEEKKTSGKKK